MKPTTAASFKFLKMALSVQLHLGCTSTFDFLQMRDADSFTSFYLDFYSIIALYPQMREHNDGSTSC